MKTVEEKAREYAKKRIILENRDKFSDEANLRAAEYYAYKAYLAGYAEATRWRDPKEELPELLPGRDYSNNVLAQVEGFTETQVMGLLYVPDEEGGWGYVWGNCYGDINGEAEWDDDYEIIGWRPIE